MVLLSICLIFCQFQPGVAYKKVLLIKKSVAYQKLMVPGTLRRHSFLHRTTTSGVKMRPVLKKIHGIYFMR